MNSLTFVFVHIAENAQLNIELNQPHLIFLEYYVTEPTAGSPRPTKGLDFPWRLDLFVDGQPWKMTIPYIPPGQTVAQNHDRPFYFYGALSVLSYLTMHSDACLLFRPSKYHRHLPFSWASTGWDRCHYIGSDAVLTKHLYRDRQRRTSGF